MFSLSHVSELTSVFSFACQYLLRNEKLMNCLQDYKFDAVMMNPLFPCGPVVAKFLYSVYFMCGLQCSLDYKATLHPSPSMLRTYRCT